MVARTDRRGDDGTRPSTAKIENIDAFKIDARRATTIVNRAEPVNLNERGKRGVTW